MNAPRKIPIYLASSLLRENLDQLPGCFKIRLTECQTGDSSIRLSADRPDPGEILHKSLGIDWHSYILFSIRATLAALKSTRLTDGNPTSDHSLQQDQSASDTI